MQKLILVGLTLILTLLVTMLVTPAFAAQVTLTWDAPTTRADGSAFALDEVASYTIYWDTVSPPTSNSMNVPISATWPSLATMTYTVTDLPYDTFLYFSVSCTDQYGQESVVSNIVSATMPYPPPPSAPVLWSAPEVGVQ